MTAPGICGAWSGCPLPRGHNMGRLDIPENHAAPPAPDPAWVEAGARALCRQDVYGMAFDDAERLASLVIAAVESLIRAKGFQEGYDAAMAAAGEMAGRRIREQIASQIEAELGPNPFGGYAEGLRDAAAIARGGAQ